jgi:uncharacterized membrane protein YbaN (DUF454 family)
MTDPRSLPVPVAIALPAAIPTKPSRLKRWALIALGYFFLVFGVIGIILPVLHGTIFFFMGLAILAQEVAWARRLRARIAQRFPRFHHISVEAEFRAQAWTRRLVRRFRRKEPLA